MQFSANGILLRGVGGLYEVLLDADAPARAGERILARARGSFRHEGEKPLVGDRVTVAFGEHAKDGGEAVISAISPRKNALIRPPMANLDVLFITVAAADPAPDTGMIDKLISIAEYNGISPVLVVGKQDLSGESARSLCEIYEKAGYPVFPLSAKRNEGVSALYEYLSRECAGKIAAFTGASGVGKSSLLNALFPDLLLETGEISKKSARGKHTTRRVELYQKPQFSEAFFADTPGFSMLDFEHFDFFSKEDLLATMRDFQPYAGNCRYADCTHTKEEGCAVLAAVRAGKIAPSRHAGYLSMYEALKNKNEWSKK